MLPALALVLAVLAPAGDGPAASPVAETTAEPDPAVRAGELFRDGEFAEAAAAFEAAYERSKDPALLFGRAQALRRAGNCKAAIEVFEQFIDTTPPEPDVRAARDVIEACRAILGEDAIEPVPPQPQPDPQPSPAPTPDHDAAAWRRDVLGGVLVGTGLGVAVGGAALQGASFRRAREREETEQAYEDRRRSARAMAGVGVGLLVTGGALVVGGVVRYVIVARRGGDRTQRTTALRAPLVWRF